MLFATPDFGSGGGVVLLLLAVWLLLIAGVVAGGWKAAKLLGRKAAAEKIRGAALLSVCVILPLTCWIGPPYLVRVIYGNYPLSRYPDGVVEGMTPAEVRTLLGPPHETHAQAGEESWYYWLDSFGARWFGVYFGPDGRVKSTGGD
jgi:outer membrane protein assembly factor BamE (lipoprotein component of BamABCDE complex)